MCYCLYILNVPAVLKVLNVPTDLRDLKDLKVLNDLKQTRILIFKKKILLPPFREGRGRQIMKKIFTFFLAVAASVGTMFAGQVQIGDLYYNLDATNQTAEVTYKSYYGYIYNEGWNITTANIPSSVTYNGVTYSVTSIGFRAFINCSFLTSVTIGNSVTSIGKEAFHNCKSLTFITIPNSVTNIGEDAFHSCSSLTSVTIPNSVTSIASGAFRYCSSLTSITIPNSVTSIGSSAFFNCSSLTSVTIGNSVTSIGEFAFSECSSLTSITLPNSVTSIADYAFRDCSSLTSITIPNSVKSIGENAFSGCSKLSSITIPNSVTSIGREAFFGCSKLSSITIPNSVTSIGTDAFYNCSSLTSVTLTASSEEDFCKGQGNSLLYSKGVRCQREIQIDGTKVTKFTISNSVTSIGEYAFFYCSSLTSVTIGNSVTSIGVQAFYNCSSLTSVTIPNSVTSIGNYAFYNCSSLTSVEAPAIFFEINEEYWVYITKSLQKVVVNSGELSENALAVINRSYKTLQSLDLSGVTNTEFADEAFKGCYNLKSLVLPSTLTRVSYMMVAECVYLENINIPATVEEIGDRAFEDCRSIQTITFGSAVPASVLGQANAPMAGTSALKKIGNWAFYNAHQLQNLEIPEGVTEIGDGAFYGCTYMEELTLPASVQSIGDNCFALCSKLTKIKCAAVVPPAIQAKTFYEVKRQIPVYVPDEAVANYKGDMYWQEFNIQAASQQDSQGIDNIQGNEVQSTKVVKDGQVLILRNGKTYTMQGQEVK